MSYNIPDGAKVLYSALTTLATAKTLATLSNADPALAGSAAHGLVAGDEVLYLGGWSDATNSMYRVANVTTDAFALAGLNSTDTNVYPAGAGAGTVRKIVQWKEMEQALTVDFSGGDTKSATISPLGLLRDISLPYGFNAINGTFVNGFDPSLTSYRDIVALARSRALAAVKLLFRDGSAIYGYGYINTSGAPQIAKGQELRYTVAFGFQGQITAYAAS